MALQEQQGAPSDEDPVQQQIIVAPEDSTERPGQQQPTGNSHDQPASLQVPTPTLGPLGEDQREPQKSNDCVYATGPGTKICLPPSDEQTPSKTARPAKGKGKWCARCTELKTQPGKDGRSRRNAAYGCKDCAKLRGEAGPRGWKLDVPSKQRQERNRGFDPGTESDDSDNPPKPNIDNPLVDRFGTQKDPSLSNRQIQSIQAIQGFGQPRTTYPPQPPLHQSSVVSGARHASFPPARTATSTLNTRSPSQVVGLPDQPSLYEDHPRPMDTPRMYDFTSSLATNNASGPQQQRSGGRPGVFSLFPPVPSPSSGGPSYPNAIQGNASFSSAFTYPDPMECELYSTSSHFDDAFDRTELFKEGEALLESDSTGGPSRGPTAVPTGRFHNTFEAPSPAQLDLSGMPGPANPAPANPPVCQRPAGLQPGSIDPLLSGATQ
ncbi:hypothetical protein INS49_009603 [Diaporthe citri]|uniref:uncharacterized protein n=1 Tax=Diaporthe citri TaxID=83186 RepID=UPI001C7F4340|nr:uncharacterized protein INS49_009603 [Diaporthe citri]KAG6361376.1 hypothetical protein INS49_009603 [Diaporthe citri]